METLRIERKDSKVDNFGQIYASNQRLCDHVSYTIGIAVNYCCLWSNFVYHHDLNLRSEIQNCNWKIDAYLCCFEKCFRYELADGLKSMHSDFLLCFIFLTCLVLPHCWNLNLSQVLWCVSQFLLLELIELIQSPQLSKLHIWSLQIL